MSEKESRAERAWNWFLRFMGASVFVYGAVVPKSEVGYFYGFIGICLAVLSTSDVRAILKSWRNGGSKGAS